MKLTNSRRVAMALLICSAAAACAPQTRGDLPTVDEARVFLSQIVVLARRGDFTGLCAIGDGNCERSLDTAGRNAVPAAPPTVVGVRLVPTTRTGDQESTGGVVLELCGQDATGKPYHSEMLVFRDGSGLRATNPVFWGNVMIDEGNSTPASPRLRPSSCGESTAPAAP